MFSSRRNPESADHFEYLQKLVVEYQDTSNEANKQQVMANLANFAYDPVHHAHLLELNCVELFLDALEDSDRDTVCFAIGGLCNMSINGRAVRVMVEEDGMPLVHACLRSADADTVIKCITTLLHMITQPPVIAMPLFTDIATTQVVECVRILRDRGADKRVRNIAAVFIEEVDRLRPMYRGLPDSPPSASPTGDV